MDQNYLNNAVRIEDFNIMANTLSVKKKAKVILITDACHSGKLAGSDNKGRALVGEQLTQVKNNEIRIASCESEQLSQEDVAWGGGRGAFSYYLVNGLKGLADKGGEDDRDGVVTLFELKDYLEDKVTTDVIRIKSEEQIPVVEGRLLTKMSIVDDDVLDSLNNLSNNVSQGQSGGSRSVNSLTTPADLYFEALVNQDFSERQSIKAWGDIPETVIINQVLKNYPIDLLVNIDQESNSHLSADDITNWSQSLNTDVKAQNDFKYRLAAMLHDKVQEAINDYLIGDREHLEKRQYYNLQPEEFIALSTLLQNAMVLINEENYLHQIMKAKSLYFDGIATRLEVYQNPNTDSLITEAISIQNKALAIDDKAAYVNNELGILYKIKKDLTTAETFFTKALQLAPKWALPYSNLGGLYLQTDEFEKGLDYANKAILLQPDYHMAYISRGRNAEQLNNLLLAEESYLKAIKLNDQHFLPYENLAYLYLKTGNYSKSQFYFEEVERLLSGVSLAFLPTSEAFDAVLDMDGHGFDTPSICLMDPEDFGSQDVMAFTVYAMEKLELGDTTTAEIYFKKAVMVNPNNPIVYRYLGDIAYFKKDLVSAEDWYTRAKSNYLPKDEFDQYCLTISHNQQYKECNVLERYMELHFKVEDLSYLLGDIYTDQNHFDLAEIIYKDLIKSYPSGRINYMLLWQLYEKQGRYEDAQNTIHNFGHQTTKSNYYAELFAFYNRCISAGLSAVEYDYKSASLLYRYIMESPSSDFQEFGIARKDEELYASPMSMEQFQIRGTQKYFSYSSLPSLPVTGAIKIYESILPQVNKGRKAEILIKLGDLKDFMGYDQSSKEYYVEAEKMIDNWASLRMKLFEKYTYFDELTAALRQLDKMDMQGQLLYRMYPEYIEMNIHEGKYLKSDSLLTRAEYLSIQNNSDLTLLKAKRYLLSENPYDAIKEYKNVLINREYDPELNYSIARTYAYMNQKKNALNHLKIAVNNDFNYTYVLDKDPFLSTLREEKKYNEIRNLLPTSDNSFE